MTNTNSNPNLQVPSPCLDEPPPPPVPPPPPPPKKPSNCVQCSRLLKDSPARRSGPQGPGTLCNACGLRILKRKRVARGVKKSTRRTRTNTSSRKPPQQRNNPTQPPLYPALRHSPSASTDVTPSSTSLQNSAQPPLFPTVSHPQSHTDPTTDPRLSPVSSATTSVTQTPTVSYSQPAPLVKPENLHVVHPNSLPSTTDPAHSIVPPSRPLHAHVQSPVQDHQVTPSVQQTPSNAEPLPLQLSTAVNPNNPNLVNHSPHHAIQSLSEQYTDPDSASAEQMLSALQIGASLETAAQVSENDFSSNVFGRCDSAGTTSTQLDLVEVLEGIEVSSEQMPPGNGMIPVEGQFDENGTVDPMAMAMGSMPMATTPVSMAPAAFSGMLPMQSSPMPNLVMQPSGITTCMNSLTTLGQMNSQISNNVSNMNIRLAALTRKHEEITRERNELSLSITQLVREKNVEAKRQRQVCDDIARTTCLLHYLQKQQSFPTGA